MEDASGFSGLFQFIFGDYEDRFGVLFFGVSFVFSVYKVLFLIIIVAAFQRPKITSWLINSLTLATGNAAPYIRSAFLGRLICWNPGVLGYVLLFLLFF